MDRLQLLQGRLPAADALHKHTQSDATRTREHGRVWTHVRTQAAHLTLASEAPLVQPGPDALDPPSMLRVAAVVPTDTLVLLHLRVVHQACTHTRLFWIFHHSFHEFWTEKRTTPVVKRSCRLDRVKDGTAVAACEGGREVEAGEDWVRMRGWWGQIRAGML